MQRHTFQSILLVALAAGLALASAGCVQFTVSTTISRDGSGSRTIETVLDRSLADIIKLSGQESTAAFEQQLRSSLPANATLRSFVREGRTHYVARFNFASVADLNRINRGRSKRDGPDSPRATLRTGRNLIFLTYDFREYLPPLTQPLTEEEGNLVRDFSVEYRLMMPGDITSSDSDRLAGSSTAIWKVGLTKGRSIRVSSRVVDWALVAGILLGVAAVVAAIIVAVLAIRGRRGKEGTAHSEVEQ